MRQQTKIIEDLFDMNSLTDNERKIFHKYIERFDKIKKVSLKVGTKPINVENVGNATLTNCDGNRELMMLRERMEQERNLPIKVIKKKEHHKIFVDEQVVDQLVTNIRARSTKKGSKNNSQAYNNMAKISISHNAS